ncbi:MAG TPA: hypothetical protein VFK06_20660 [Candidatus Angelobacter sp.]|nr:hypothetical protein [Candidatus Angelobacter sp.]
MSSTPSAPNPQIPDATSSEPPKRSKAFLWILGILGGSVLLVILVVGIAMAFFAWKVKQQSADFSKNPDIALVKLSAKFNKNLEIVSSDDSTSTIVVRNKKDGKSITMKFDPAKKAIGIQNERGDDSAISISGSESSPVLEFKNNQGIRQFGASAGSAPVWLPSYPGSPSGNMASVREREKSSSVFIFTTQDSPEKVIDFYSHALKSAGFTTSATATAEAKMSGTINGEDKGKGRSVSVVITSDSNGNNVSVMYSEKIQIR